MSTRSSGLTFPYPFPVANVDPLDIVVTPTANGRVPNRFIIFRKFCYDCTPVRYDANGGTKSQTAITKSIDQVWKGLSTAQKQPFVDAYYREKALCDADPEGYQRAALALAKAEGRKPRKPVQIIGEKRQAAGKGPGRQRKARGGQGGPQRRRDASPSAFPHMVASGSTQTLQTETGWNIGQPQREQAPLIDDGLQRAPQPEPIPRIDYPSAPPLPNAAPLQDLYPLPAPVAQLAHGYHLIPQHDGGHNIDLQNPQPQPYFDSFGGVPLCEPYPVIGGIPPDFYVGPNGSHFHFMRDGSIARQDPVPLCQQRDTMSADDFTMLLFAGYSRG